MITKTYRIWRFFCAWFVHLIFFTIPHGRENEPDISKGPYLLCSNHISASDPIMVCSAVKKQQPRYMAKKEIFSWPIIGKVVTWLGAYPVDRAGKDAGVIIKTVKMLEDGCTIGLFPQGTRRPGVDPSTTPVRHGAGLILAKSKVQVLPVYIKTKNNKKRFLRPVHLYIGKPIPYDEYTANGQYADDYKYISEYVFGKVCELGRQHADK